MTGRGIIAGEPCAQAQHPSAAALVLEADFGGGELERVFGCSGVFVAPDVVLTAAHCLDLESIIGVEPSQMSRHTLWVTRADAVVQGELPDDAVLMRASVIHPDFDSDALDGVEGLADLADLGLVFLERAVADVHPTVVITEAEADLLEVGAGAEIVGWGYAEAPTLEVTPRLGERRCAASFLHALGASEVQVGFCGPRKCHGDSGGPTYVTLIADGGAEVERLLGIASHAIGGGYCARGAADTRLDVRWAWLDGAMRAACDDGTRADCAQEGLLVAGEAPGVALAVRGRRDPPELVCPSIETATVTVEGPRVYAAPVGCRASGGLDGLAGLLLGILMLLCKRSR